MKIAILTYWESSDNYGQILQCFALQRYLIDCGYDTYLVKYSPREQQVSIFRKIGQGFKRIIGLSQIKKYVALKKFQKEEYQLRTINEKQNVYRDFSNFRNHYIRSTEKIYYSINDLKNNPPEADLLICGSDQVWRDSLKIKNVAGWFLQFGNEKTRRISYAASVGRTIANSEREIFSRYLSKFNAISVREKATCEFCRQIGYDNTKLVCDPTLLLTGDYYKEIFEIPGCVDKNPYIFFYTLNILSKDEIAWDVIDKQRKRRKLAIKAVASSGYYQARSIIPGVENILATIPEWMTLILNAKYVVTTSFHGVVFSILFHKPFIAISLKGKYSDANNRIRDLLTELGLEACLCSDEEEIDSAFDSTINWETVEKKLEKYRERGIKFLERNIK